MFDEDYQGERGPRTPRRVANLNARLNNLRVNNAVDDQLLTAASSNLCTTQLETEGEGDEPCTDGLLSERSDSVLIGDETSNLQNVLLGSENSQPVALPQLSTTVQTTTMTAAASLPLLELMATQYVGKSRANSQAERKTNDGTTERDPGELLDYESGFFSEGLSETNATSQTAGGGKEGPGQGGVTVTPGVTNNDNLPCSSGPSGSSPGLDSAETTVGISATSTPTHVLKPPLLSVPQYTNLDELMPYRGTAMLDQEEAAIREAAHHESALFDPFQSQGGLSSAGSGNPVSRNLAESYRAHVGERMKSIRKGPGPAGNSGSSRRGPPGAAGVQNATRGGAVSTKPSSAGDKMKKSDTADSLLDRIMYDLKENERSMGAAAADGIDLSTYKYIYLLI